VQKIENRLKIKLGILERLSTCDELDSQVFAQKLEVLKDVALILINEIEALNCVRSVNISQGISLHEEMRTFEVHLIQSALERTGGHQTRAAQLLGINLTTLHNKLKRLNISPNELIIAPIIHEDSIYPNQSVKETLSPLADKEFSHFVA
jgi:transcriptional regulator with GAF, ATPase, and Fis domain